MMVETSTSPLPRCPPPPAGTCSELILHMLLKLSLSSPPPSLKVSVCCWLLLLLLQHLSEAVSSFFSVPVDRLTELLLDSSNNKQNVTNGNQELSSELPVLFSGFSGSYEMKEKFCCHCCD